MALPAVTRVCGDDERVQVDPETSPPYKWICFLTKTKASGKVSYGSGFKIHLPDVNRTAVVTSGHCTFDNDETEYAQKITVQFPGEAAVEVGRDDLYAAPEYIKSGSADHDYGLILLPGRSDDGFGWSTIVQDKELDNRLVTNCGYPGDKPRGTMWITGGEIEKYTANRIFYMNDTVKGQSGSPVYTWYGGYWTVLAVHSYGGCPNSAPRFTSEMIYRFLERMNGLKLKSLRSEAFPDVYVRCDGSGVNAPAGHGAGTVNCQYKPVKGYERFFIYPVEMPPSLAPQNIYKVVIESVAFKYVFIRLDSKEMSQHKSHGGGEVNCQYYPPRSYESFFLRQEANGTYSFRSVAFPHCFLRLDGKKVTSWSSSGGGTVNCQYYDNPSFPASAYERFYVEEH